MCMVRASVMTGIRFGLRVLIRVWPLARVRVWFELSPRLWLGPWLC